MSLPTEISCPPLPTFAMDNRAGMEMIDRKRGTGRALVCRMHALTPKTPKTVAVRRMVDNRSVG